MDVETTRFGAVNVDDERLMTFPAGLLGFTAYKTYALLQPDSNGAFLWLQSVEAPELAFVVTDPTMWVADYQVPIRREQMQELSLESLDDAASTARAALKVVEPDPLAAAEYSDHYQRWVEMSDHLGQLEI